MNYALIENGVVTNIIWLSPNNAKDFPNAVYYGDIPVGVGDSYIDGKFYRDGKEVKPFGVEAYEALTILGVTE